MSKARDYELELFGNGHDGSGYTTRNDVMQDLALIDTLESIEEGTMLLYSAAPNKISITDIRGRDCGWCFDPALYADIQDGTEFVCRRGRVGDISDRGVVKGVMGFDLEFYEQPFFVTFTPRPEQKIEETRGVKQTVDA